LKREIASALKEFVAAADNLLGNKIVAAYCFGSAIYDDFHLGYSDLDFFIIVGAALSQGDFQAFHELRAGYKRGGNPYLAVLEGEIVPYSAIKSGRQGSTIYWGTTKDRFNREYGLRGFSMCGLLDAGYLIQGRDIRGEIPYPSGEEMLAQVASMIETIRKHAAETDRDIHSADWLFLISQSLYWLKTGRTTGKTPAAQWVLANCRYPWQGLMEKAVELRLSPALARQPAWQLWLEQLGEGIQEACSYLEAELKSEGLSG
jgi:predicted nucleotidyltransferase